MRLRSFVACLAALWLVLALVVCLATLEPIPRDHTPHSSSEPRPTVLPQAQNGTVRSTELRLRRSSAAQLAAELRTHHDTRRTPGSTVVHAPAPYTADAAATPSAARRWPFTDADALLLTAEGRIRLTLVPEAVSARRYVAELLAREPACGALEPSPEHPPRDGLRFYRAEPRPAHWADPAWPDSWQGGRWGPPYALLQGSIRPVGAAAAVKLPTEEAASSCHPVIKRGMVAWAGGRGGPDFFIAVADHPEWQTGHTVWASVLAEDMEVVDAILRRPLRVANWGSINATELVTPLPFCLQPVNGSSLEKLS